VNFECNMLISVLKLTKNGSALIKDINTEARLPQTLCMELLQKLQNENIIKLKNETAEIKTEERIKIAIKTATLGADIQHISTLMHWQEFEQIAAIALKYNGYSVHNNIRFKHENKRYEIDVIGCRKPLVICIDCKHWAHTITTSALRKIVEQQTQRTKALSDTQPNTKLNLEYTQWEKATFIPTVISLIPSAYKFHDQVPIVPILSLQDFINQLPFHIENVKTHQKFITSTYITSDEGLGA